MIVETRKVGSASPLLPTTIGKSPRTREPGCRASFIDGERAGLRVLEWVPTGMQFVPSSTGCRVPALLARPRCLVGTGSPRRNVDAHIPLIERTITRRIYGAPVETVMGGVVYQAITVRGNNVVDIDPPGKNDPFYQRNYYRREPRWRKATHFVSDEAIEW